MTRAIARNGIIREKNTESAQAGAPMKPMNQPPRGAKGEGRNERGEERKKARRYYERSNGKR